MKRAYLVWLVITLLAFPIMAQRTNPGLRKVRRSEQREFNAEETVKNPVKMPNAVLRLLGRDERVQQCLKDGLKQKAIESWFTASAISLNEDRKFDLVVKPENSCLFGANIVPFWIFRATKSGYELVLKTHTLGLSILRSKNNGYRDVEADAATAAMIYGVAYKFNGKRYVPKKCWEQNIDDAEKGRAKITYVKCSSDIEKPY